MHLLPQPGGEVNRTDRSAPCGPPLVVFRDAAVALGGRTIWEHATFEIRPGEFIAVVGPNGCGKSTLLRMILGQIPASAGDVQVLGAPPRLGHRAVGLVPQRRELTSGLAIRGRDLVLLGIEGSHWGFGRPSAAARQQADWCWRRSTCGSLPTSRWACCPAASSSACSSPRSWRRNSRSCCWTSHWPASTSAASRRSSPWWTACAAGRAWPCCSSATTSIPCCPWWTGCCTS